MAPRTTAELTPETLMPIEYAVGTRVSVEYTIPSAPVVVTYLGEIAVTPTQKLSRTVACNKYGPLRSIQVEPSYTLKTETMIRREFLQTEDGETIYDDTFMSPSYLIFRADDPAFTIHALPGEAQ